MTNLELCNLALSRIGEKTIGSLSEDGKPAKLCSQFLQSSVDCVLTLHPWSCAMKRAALTAGTAPAFGWAARYAVPADCLRPVGIEPDDEDFVFEGGFILCNAENVKLLYVARPSDVSGLSPMVARLCAYKLASEIAYNLSGSPSLIETLDTQFQRALVEARGIDAQEQNYKPERRPSWLNSRL
jgi:hypothetical protein